MAGVGGALEAFGQGERLAVVEVEGLGRAAGRGGAASRGGDADGANRGEVDGDARGGLLDTLRVEAFDDLELSEEIANQG